MLPLLLVAVACGSGVSEPAAADTEANSAEFYDQQLEFGSCDGFAVTPLDEQAFAADPTIECSRLSVPIDHEDPAGATARIAVLRVPARGEPQGSVVLNPGGPGYGGTHLAPMLGAAWADTPIGENFDLVGFDPRGTGASEPALDCYTDAMRDDDATPGSLVGDGSVDPVQLAERCADSVGGRDALAHFGTRDAARDMDVLRAALGDEQLTYVGASYGTRLGPVYAEMFPEKVRAMVFDGAIDPTLGTVDGRILQFTGLQRSFDEMAQYCAADPACPLGTDPSQASTVLHETVRPLLDTPLPVSDGRELSFIAAIDGILIGLYSEEIWPVAIDALARLQEGHGDALLALRDGSQGRGDDGTYADSLEASLAIKCADEERMDPAANAEYLRALIAAAPFLDSGKDLDGGIPSHCEGWPGEPGLPGPYATDIPDLPTTLTISVTGDATTPHEGGISLAETLDGSLLTVDGDQHGTVLAGNSCINDAIADYLIDLTAPPAGARCSL